MTDIRTVAGPVDSGELGRTLVERIAARTDLNIVVATGLYTETILVDNPRRFLAGAKA